MSSVEYQEKVRWFKEARFGIYVHFGLYSVLGRGEWTMYSERINPAGYAKLANDFIPDPNCVKEWVETAQAAGANYMVLTTRHHEGFSLFDSKYSNFTAAKHGCKALAICSVSDSLVTGEEIDADARERTLNNMITVALDTAVQF